MANKFTDYVSKVCASWLNTVDDVVFDALGQAKTPTEARTNIGALADAPTDGVQYARQAGAWTQVIGSNPITIHNDLDGRDVNDVHPLLSITGLQAELNNRPTEAPQNGTPYCRQNAGWVPAPSGGGGVTIHNELTNRDAADAHPQAAITGLTAALASKIGEAPSDGKTYGRKSMAWAEIIAGATSWGLITGTLSAQTDLQNALNAKLAHTGGTIANYGEMAGTVAAASGTATLDLATAVVHDVTLAADTAITLANTTAHPAASLTVKLATAGHAPTFPNVAGWIGGVPVWESGTFILAFFLLGGSWYGSGDLVVTA